MSLLSTGLKHILASVLTKFTTPVPLTDRHPVYQAGGGGAIGYMTTAQITGRQAPDPSPLPIDGGVVDLTVALGNYGEISDASDITGFILEAGRKFTVRCTTGGNVVTNGANLVVSGGDYKAAANDEINLVGEAGDVVRVIGFLTARPDLMGASIAQAKIDSGAVKFGDVDAEGNETTIVIDDAAHTIQLKSNDSFADFGASILLGGLIHSVAISAATLILNCRDGAAVLGDQAGVGNSTKITVNDVAETITLKADNGIIIQDVMKLTPVIFDDLPGSPTLGMIAAVNDANVAAWGSIVNSGGGHNEVGIMYRNGDWYVFAGE